MNSLHTSLLDAYFWAYIDAGTVPEQTPLLLGAHHGAPLAEIIAADYGVSPLEAEEAIEAACQEVAL